MLSHWCFSLSWPYILLTDWCSSSWFCWRWCRGAFAFSRHQIRRCRHSLFLCRLFIIVIIISMRARTNSRSRQHWTCWFQNGQMMMKPLSKSRITLSLSLCLTSYSTVQSVQNLSFDYWRRENISNTVTCRMMNVSSILIDCIQPVIDCDNLFYYSLFACQFDRPFKYFTSGETTLACTARVGRIHNQISWSSPRDLVAYFLVLLFYF